MITFDELRQIASKTGVVSEGYVTYLNDVMAVCDISNPLREAAFLSHLLYTSDEFARNPYAGAAAARWHAGGMNEFADKDDFLLLTKRLLGGRSTNYRERSAFYERAKEVFAK